jgi:hypothetical protein
MHLDHTAASYVNQLFVVWVRGELVAFEIISFLTSAGRRVFCIVIDDAFSSARCESYANRDRPLATTPQAVFGEPSRSCVHAGAARGPFLKQFRKCMAGMLGAVRP